MRLRTLVLTLVASLLWVSSTSARTLYVDNQMGSDYASGLTSKPVGEDAPLRTLNAALALAEKSDRIVVANTGIPYHESISLSLPKHSGRPGRPFVIEGNGAVLDGTVSHDIGAWKHVEGNVFGLRPRRLTYQQLFSGGQPLKRSAILSRYEVNQLKPLEWALVDRKLYFCTEEGRIPSEYDLRHCGLQTGITLYMVRHVRIENLVVQGFQQDGVNAHELVKDCELLDLELRANGRAGLSVGGVSNVTAIRSNMYDNGRVQVRNEGLSRLTLEACDVDDTGAPKFKSCGRSLIVDGEIVPNEVR